MGWRMKNFNIYNILGVHGKIWVLVGKGGGGGHKKQYIRRLPKKGGWLRHFADLQGGNGRGFGKKEVSGVFEEGWW